MRNLLSVFAIVVFICSCKHTKESIPSHSANFIKNFHEGVRLKHSGEINAAIEKFNLCLKEDINDDASHFGIAQLYLMKDDLANAAIHTKKASELDPKNTFYLTELAYMYQELQQYEQSAEIFDKLAKLNSQNPEYYLGSIDNWSKANKNDKAILVLNNYEKNIGSNPELSLKKFQLLIRIKQEKEALTVLLDAKNRFPNEPSIIANLVDYYMQRKQFETGMKMLKELIVADPNNGMALLMLGEMEMQYGEEQVGFKHLKEAVRNEGVTLDQKMEVLIAIQNMNNTDSDMESLVNYMTNRYPNEAKAHSIKGDYYFKQNNFSQATEAYKKAVNVEPNLYPIWNQILLLEYQNQWFDSLLIDSEKCLSYFPIQPMPYFMSGVAKIQKKEFTSAIKRLQEGLDLILNDLPLESEIYSQLGVAFFGLKDLEKGKLYFEKSISKQPNNLFLKNNYAFQLALHKIDLEKAEKLIDGLLEVEPEDARFLDTKGWILFVNDKFKLAQEYFIKANLTMPNDKIIVEHLGDVSFKLGDKTRAVEYWIKAKELKSSNGSLERKIQNKAYYDPIY